MKFQKNRASKQPPSRGSLVRDSGTSPGRGNRPASASRPKKPTKRRTGPRPSRPAPSTRRESDDREFRQERSYGNGRSIDSDSTSNASTGVRLVKYLAACGVASRRKAADFVFDKRVTSNGEVVTDVSYSVEVGKDRVAVDGKPLYQAESGLLLFYKPRYVISTLSDPHGRKNISTYLTSRYRSYVPVGRLDFESEGLMIFTNDGDFCNVLLHPRYELERTYEVHCPTSVSDSQLRKLEDGVELEDGFAQADIKLMHRANDHSAILVTIKEGRNRQVRRMFEAVGAEVVQLKRTVHGPFTLGNLKSGEIKKLSEREFSRIREKVMRESQKETKTKAGPKSRSRR